ncbi:SRP54-type protein, GTPase domain-containing protein [Ditylenchus destructor]|nr:SRP54-type protein, GTPase domain-containing protein [Ditylenchus destructor]
MIELFTIFGKGGLILWCFSEGSQYFKEAVNELISTVLLQERNVTSFNREGATIKYKLDNELDIIVLVVYQSMIQLAYSDKLLTEIQIRFRDLYKNVLMDNRYLLTGPKTFNGFTSEYNRILTSIKMSSAIADSAKPRTFQESDKSKKTVASMIETAADRAAAKAKQAKEAKKKESAAAKKPDLAPPKPDSQPSSNEPTPHSSPNFLHQKTTDSEIDEDVLQKRNEFFQKKKGKTVSKSKESSSQAAAKKGKQARVWELTGKAKDTEHLDYSAPTKKVDTDGTNEENELNIVHRDTHNFYQENIEFVGKLKGELPGLDEGEAVGESSDEEKETNTTPAADVVPKTGWFSAFKSLVGNKQLNKEDLEPVLEKMKETLIGKNVAAEPAIKICESVGSKLEGKVISTFSRVSSTVREAMRDSLVQLLTPKRRVDILRDIMEAKAQKRPYVIVFCGVNGVGKSTNLAKITFWLNENSHRVLIAAGDTFRAGAVEQLRTHTRHLNALHPQFVQLYEQGYGKDPASLAAAAIQIADERQIDVVLVDTAGRMQDNEPLMRALSKLIRVNEPDLVLFVGEALVGNEAVDQLVKFNHSLADNSATDAKPRLIDGIMLTKFDTIDDKVGAAVSMTYITGQPIVFVGTGQTYKDLKNLNINAVVNSLLK